MIYDELQKLVDEQAEDEGLWGQALYASEDYIQSALRKLTKAIEDREPTENKNENQN